VDFFTQLMEGLAGRAGAPAWLDGAAAPAYDERGFDAAGLHRDTGTRLDPEGFTCDGYDLHGFDRRGLDRDGCDRRGFSAATGLHRATGTPFSPEGFDAHGRDASGTYRWRR
jgi:hypothetical protein